MHTIPSHLPRVALVGRRNVGKSTLYNALCRKRYAITDETPGLTRDILETNITNQFSLSDTPGLDIKHPNELEKQIMERASRHLKSLDLILFILAAPFPHSVDWELNQFVRKNVSETPILSLVNKVDRSDKAEEALLPFYEAGWHHLLPISAKGRWNLEILLERIQEILSHQKNKAPKRKTKTMQGKTLKLAIVGRPNVGKSSLFNRILGEERALVSEISGTTRDSVDTIVQHPNGMLQIIDTAGMQRRSRTQENHIAYYSLSRTKRAIEESQVVIQVVDGIQGLTDLDKKICSMVQFYQRAIVFALSKWDLLKVQANNGLDFQHLRKELAERMQFLFPHIRKLPFVFFSSLSGHGIKSIMKHCWQLAGLMEMHISTPELNKKLDKWKKGLPSLDQRLKILYLTQAKASPPSFIFFVNKPKLFRLPLKSYFENRIRKEYKLIGIPLRIEIRARLETGSTKKGAAKKAARKAARK